MKTYVLTLSKQFPHSHKRAGEPTLFAARVFQREKIHTIRNNYPLWAKRIKEIQQGEAVLSIRQWEGLNLLIINYIIMKHTESNLQRVCLRWARMQYQQCRKMLFSVPNGAHLSLLQARILKAEGMTAGVADMLLLYPSHDGKYCGLAIEFKAVKGRQSELQKEWQKELPAAYRYVIVRTFDEFQKLLQEHFGY